MTDDPERAVRRYLEKNPRAGVLDVISDFIVGPEHRELVEEIVGEESESDSAEHTLVQSTNPESAPTESEAIDTSEPPSAAQAPAAEVPDLFHGLGEIAIPIPPRQKGPELPRTEEYLHDPADDVIQAYLEAGHNWGLSY